ncbi:MAG: plasmid mobilization relaxosome protein MobC [Microbacteriaceae bacterium]|nr:plasmid mobilization relaxosome protein MobC [Microbacteriaceae bacterium]
MDEKPTRRRRVEGGRQRRHVVRVTAEEEAQLRDLSARYRVSVPKLLVDSALSGGADAAVSNASVRAEVLTSLFAAQRQIAGIANNVNQLAKFANANGFVPGDAAAALDEARRTTMRISGLVDEIGASLR